MASPSAPLSKSFNIDTFSFSRGAAQDEVMFGSRWDSILSPPGTPPLASLPFVSLSFAKNYDGWYRGSIAILKLLSRSSGIIRASNGLQISRHGLVLASIKNTLKFSSIMKSYPKISKQLEMRLGSIFEPTALNESVTSRSIWGKRSRMKQTFFVVWFRSK